MAYGARLESVLSESSQGFESPILRHRRESRLISMSPSDGRPDVSGHFWGTDCRYAIVRRLAASNGLTGNFWHFWAESGSQECVDVTPVRSRGSGLEKSPRETLGCCPDATSTGRANSMKSRSIYDFSWRRHVAATSRLTDESDQWTHWASIAMKQSMAGSELRRRLCTHRQSRCRTTNQRCCRPALGGHG